jgi:hypothetical protein
MSAPLPHPDDVNSLMDIPAIEIKNDLPLISNPPQEQFKVSLQIQANIGVADVKGLLEYSWSRGGQPKIGSLYVTLPSDDEVNDIEKRFKLQLTKSKPIGLTELSKEVLEWDNELFKNLIIIEDYDELKRRFVTDFEKAFILDRNGSLKLPSENMELIQMINLKYYSYISDRYKSKMQPVYFTKRFTSDHSGRMKELKKNKQKAFIFFAIAYPAYADTCTSLELINKFHDLKHATQGLINSLEDD